MIGDRDFHHQQQASQICTFHNCSANLFANDSTRAIRDTLAIALDAGRLSTQTKFGTGIITCRRKPDADWAYGRLI